MLILLSTVMVYAEGNTLTVQDAVKIATENSLEVMKYTNAVKRYQRDYADSLVSSRQMKDMLEIDARFRKLSLNTSRTPSEEFEYEMLGMMLKRYMSASERLEMAIASELTPNQMEYMLNVNKALLKSTNENIYLTIYGHFDKLTKADNAIRIKSALITNLEGNYRAAEAKYAQGKLSLNNLNTIKFELQKSKIELSSLQLEKNKTIIELNRSLGKPLDYQHTDYVNEEIPETVMINTLQEYIDLAYTNNDDFKNAKEYFEIKKKEYDMTTGLYVYEASVQNMEAYIKYNEAKDQFEAADIRLQQQVLNSFTSFQNQLNTLEKSKIKLDLDDRKLQELKSKYNLGLITELELSKAYISYNESQLGYLSAKRDMWFAKMQLDLICGISKNNN